jgi:hypothetical protein
MDEVATGSGTGWQQRVLMRHHETTGARFVCGFQYELVELSDTELI